MSIWLLNIKKLSTPKSCIYDDLISGCPSGVGHWSETHRGWHQSGTATEGAQGITRVSRSPWIISPTKMAVTSQMMTSQWTSISLDNGSQQNRKLAITWTNAVLSSLIQYGITWEQFNSLKGRHNCGEKISMKHQSYVYNELPFGR